jgi:rhomboid family GlyGly-CTERM serine protease
VKPEWRIPWITLGLAGLACLVQASPALTAACQFDRAAVARGELWRMFAGHLAHFGADHLLWDVAALLVLGTMGEARERRATFAGLLTGAALAISLAVWVWQPRFATYRGLSGLDSALFGLVCARLVGDGRRARHAFSVWLGALALGGFALKCGFELVAGETVFAAGGGESYAPVPLAHLVGWAVGVAVAGVAKAREGVPAQPLIAAAPN